MTYTIFRRYLSAVLCNFCVIASGHVENYRELCVIPDYTKPLRKTCLRSRSILLLGFFRASIAIRSSLARLLIGATTVPIREL